MSSSAFCAGRQSELKLDFILRGPELGLPPGQTQNVRTFSVPVTMNIGETVVVGTSQVGGSRAVLVLLTAEGAGPAPER